MYKALSRCLRDTRVTARVLIDVSVCEVLGHGRGGGVERCGQWGLLRATIRGCSPQVGST